MDINKLITIISDDLQDFEPNLSIIPNDEFNIRYALITKKIDNTLLEILGNNASKQIIADVNSWQQLVAAAKEQSEELFCAIVTLRTLIISLLKLERRADKSIHYENILE